MGQRLGGTVATMVISVPIAAVLMMAVFGVPRIAPGVNGQQQTVWQDPREFIDELRGQPGQPAVFDDYQSDHPGERSPNPFATEQNSGRSARMPGNAPGWGTESSSGNRRPENSRGTTDHEGHAHISPVPNGSGGSFDDRFSGPAHRADSEAIPHRSGPFGGTGDAMTWQEASRKLVDLGVEHYRIEAGSVPGQFVFICQFSPGDDRQVIQRFEAERRDPLEAVIAAIAQIEEYLRKRYREGNQSLIPIR